MFPIDLSFVTETASAIPVLKDIPPKGQEFAFVAIVVQGILSTLRLALTGNKTKENAPTHWFNRFMSRFGPVVNMGIGALIGLGTTITFPLALAGGGFSAWTYAFLNNTIVPSVKSAWSVMQKKG